MWFRFKTKASGRSVGAGVSGVGEGERARKRRSVLLKRTCLIGVLALCALLVTGCQTLKFYKQALAGQYEIWEKQQPISRVLADPNTPLRTKQKLELVEELRRFAAKELKLPVNGNYEKYADLKRRYVVWDVYAAPEFSLESRNWWYPFVGNLDYRGYFSEPGAVNYAQRLARDGYDVYVGGVEAYSTLGWFKDPVLNTFLFNAPPDLAETLFHELAHRRVFASGDTPFDEAFATAVAEEGVRRWLLAKHDQGTWDKYLVQHRRDHQFVQLIMATREKLAVLYATRTNTPPQTSDISDKFHLAASLMAREPPAPAKDNTAQLRREKAAIIQQLRRDYQQLKAEWGGYSAYDEWFEGPLNNAQLNTVSTYERLVPAFLQLLKMGGGDLEKFYRDVTALKKLSKKERHRQLQELLTMASESPAS